MLSDISGLFESKVLEFIFHLKLLLANHIERYFPSLPRIFDCILYANIVNNVGTRKWTEFIEI